MTPNLFNRRSALLGSMAAAGATVLSPMGAQQTPQAINGRLSGNISPIHDPCAIRAGDTYYIFSTSLGSSAGGQIPWRYSKDLVNWNKGGNVLPDLPQWAKKTIEGTEGIWAPDISYVGGRYLLYYACSTFGKNRSAIGLATNTTLDPAASDYKWVDQGMVFESKPSDDFNAIDPNHVIDRDGGHWLTFGSFWGGIKMIPLDPATGKPAPGDKRISTLASRPPGSQPNAIEAPFIIARGGYYYLFCAYDFCCRGADSNYYTVVGRSPTITGPYGDHNRLAMTTGNGAIVLPHDPGSRWRGPGGASILRDGAQDYIVYHAYDARRQGTPTLRIAPLVWSSDGWPTALT
jgi:arabinan endo-1,5-alpha-L-arabinosidase